VYLASIRYVRRKSVPSIIVVMSMYHKPLTKGYSSCTFIFFISCSFTHFHIHLFIYMLPLRLLLHVCAYLWGTARSSWACWRLAAPSRGAARWRWPRWCCTPPSAPLSQPRTGTSGSPGLQCSSNNSTNINNNNNTVLTAMTAKDRYVWITRPAVQQQCCSEQASPLWQLRTGMSGSPSLQCNSNNRNSNSNIMIIAIIVVLSIVVTTILVPIIIILNNNNNNNNTNNNNDDDDNDDNNDDIISAFHLLMS